MLHRAARFERRQNRVCIDRRTLKDLVSERIRERVQNGGTPACNWWLADTARTHWRLRVGNVQRGPLHIDGYVENGWRFVVMESLRNHLAIVRIEHPLLTDGMADAQDRTAEHLPTQSSGMDYRSDIGRSEEIDDVVLAGLNVDFNFGKAGDVGKCRAIAWIVVLGRRHQALTC